MNLRALLLVVCLPFAAFADDAKLPSFIKPYPGQKPYGSPEVSAFDEVHLPAAKLKSPPPAAEYKTLQGKITQLHFDMPEGRSQLEVFKNYEDALLKAGFEKVFGCAEETCGDTQGVLATWKGATNSFISSKNRYVLTKLNRPEGTAWVAVYITGVGLPLTKVIIAEEKPMDTGMVKVDAGALKSALERDGHIAVYGIVFDSGKATLKAESASALEEVKKLLELEPKLKLYVVGHTDDEGQESANLALSNSRAAAVVKELTGPKYKVAANRLKSYGVGPYVPVATNRNDAGKAKNRRVELVEDVP